MLNEVCVKCYNTIYVITGWTGLTWPSRKSGGSRYWSSWTKGKWSYGLDSYDLWLFICYVHLIGFVLLKLFPIHLQGERGSQGRPGPPGSPGVGELGPPVRKNWVCMFMILFFRTFIFVSLPLQQSVKERPWPKYSFSEFIGTSWTTRCSRR